jgi:hypothetical protein
VIALVGVLLLGGSGLAMTLRNRPRPAMAQAVAAPSDPAGPATASATEAPSHHAFERLPDHIQRDLLEISDILKGMGE